MCVADRVVERRRKLQPEIVVRPVDHRLREREHVHLDALPVHLLQARIEIDEERHDRPCSQQESDLDERPAARVLADRRAAARPELRDRARYTTAGSSGRGCRWSALGALLSSVTTRQGLSQVLPGNGSVPFFAAGRAAFEDFQTLRVARVAPVADFPERPMTSDADVVLVQAALADAWRRHAAWEQSRIRPRRSSLPSIRLRARVLHDFRPLLHLGLDELRELFGAAPDGSPRPRRTAGPSPLLFRAMKASPWRASRLLASARPPGPTTPNHAAAAKPGSAASDIVGRSGTDGERSAPVTANPFSFPAFTCGIAEERLANMKSIWPPRSAGERLGRALERHVRPSSRPPSC